MLLGILADIHEHIEPLRRALELFSAAKVDRIVLLGDVFDHGEDLEETCKILIDARPHVRGVWGNHDFGLCDDVSPDLIGRYSPEVFALFARLLPSLEVEDCRFQHIEPWLDPRKIEDLWTSPGDLLDPARITRAFEASPARVTFMGHHHLWMVNSDEHLPLAAPATEEPTSNPFLLDSPRPLTLSRPHRWFVHIGAVADHWAATYDTESSQLTPISLA